MKHGSLFSGIGGFDLAAEWMGWENVFHCEWNPFGQKVLNHYWPKAETFTDITKSDFKKFNGTIDIISGGFPCQPYSQAGKRKGKEDERHLWPEMLRAIREVQPSYVVGENVRGLTNWNGGLVFDEVQADLESEGYEVLPFLLPACAVNAPHRRDRIWFIAFNSELAANGRHNTRKGGREGMEVVRNFMDEAGWNEGTNNTKPSSSNVTDTPKQGRENRNEEFDSRFCGKKNNEGCFFDAVERFGDTWNAANTNSRRQPGKEHGQEKPRRIAEKSIPNDWSNFPTQSPLCSRNDGISSELVGITFSKHRNESIKAYGNAIVPQVVFEIFKAIEAYDRT